MERLMPNHFPAAPGFEPPNPPIESEQERVRKWKLREAEAERERIWHTFALEGLARGHELKVVPNGRRFRVGYVSATSGQGFTMVDSGSRQEIDIRYSEIEAIYFVRSRGENAKSTVEASA
jgi:hypothetical protein